MIIIKFVKFLNLKMLILLSSVMVINIQGMYDSTEILENSYTAKVKSKLKTRYKMDNTEEKKAKNKKHVLPLIIICIDIASPIKTS